MNPAMQNAKLRGVFEDLGFEHVQSFISSGNIMFESDRTDVAALEAELEAAWPEQLGFTSTTIIRGLNELTDLVAKDPFNGAVYSQKTSLNVTFLKHKPAEAIAQPTGQFYTVPAVYDREICVNIDLTTGKTPDYMIKTERAYGKQITTRSWNTVLRIIKKLESERTPLFHI